MAEIVTELREMAQNTAQPDCDIITLTRAADYIEFQWAQRVKGGDFTLTLLEALHSAADYLSAEHQNLSNGDWDDHDARDVFEKVEAAIKAASEAK